MTEHFNSMLNHRTSNMLRTLPLFKSVNEVGQQHTAWLER